MDKGKRPAEDDSSGRSLRSESIRMTVETHDGYGTSHATASDLLRRGIAKGAEGVREVTAPQTQLMPGEVLDLDERRLLVSRYAMPAQMNEWQMLHLGRASPFFQDMALSSFPPAVQLSPTTGNPVLTSSSGGFLVFDVWAETVYEAFEDIRKLLQRGEGDEFMVGVDSEFAIPDGVVHSGREPPTADLHYEQLCSMVNGGDLVQVGITITDPMFKVLGAWQFNLSFHTSWRAPWHAGVAFLRDEAKLKLEEHASHGIPVALFIHLLAGSGMINNSSLTWVSYMGYPDFGFLVRLLTGPHALPASRLEFLMLFWQLFPRSYDVRVFSKLGRCGREVIAGGLATVCQTLGVQRAGKAHHAWSDALSALQCLEKMASGDTDFARRMTRYSGVLYGVVVDARRHE
ncbi:probable CCR4-associated factor 1 homolog 10 [Phragmites australis]|uniref:probable CCR4-associated factor 1 homolog 10 n=1 Tax=Phragmites australis TaxID=29695 RepID=UPI002D78F2CA|nr:probable CCR4-associated factor 1 homolog 10 [Phragmites australis]